MSDNPKTPQDGVEITPNGDSTIRGDVAGRDIIKSVVHVAQSHQAIALVAVVAVVAVFGIVALAISNSPQSGALTQSAATTFTNAPSSALPIAATGNECLDDYMGDVTSAHQLRVEVASGEQDLIVPGDERIGSNSIGPMGVWLTQLGQPIAALKLLTLLEGNELTVFSILSIVSADCSTVTNYENVTRSSSDSSLQNWDTLGILLGESTYYLRFGWQGDRIAFNLRELE